MIVAKIGFRYGEEEIDPFAPAASALPGEENLLMLRDSAGERVALDLLAGAGFRMQRGRVVLAGQDMIYAFLTEGIYKMRECAEVYCSDAFRKMTPRRPHFTGSLRMQDGAMQLQLQDNGEPTPEVAAILQALRDRKRYFRLKDGSFLDLTDMDEWRELAEAAVGSRQEMPEDEDDPRYERWRAATCRSRRKRA